MERTQTQAHGSSNGTSGNGRAAVSNDPDEIQEDIHRTRERIDETLDAIKHQLSPGDLVNQVVKMFRSNGAVGSKTGDVLSSLARTVKENPIPIALIGIGLLGLAKDGSSGGKRMRASSLGEGDRYVGTRGEHGVGEAAEHLGEKVQDKAHEMREQVRDATHEVGEKAHEAAQQVRDKAHEVGEQVQEKAGEAREAIERGYEKVKQRIEDDPIVLGALGIALGAALGAGLPSTRLEDEKFGEKRDELAGKVKRTAKQVGQQIREGARQVKDETMQQLES
jgi:gas vesicle protein